MMKTNICRIAASMLLVTVAVPAFPGHQPKMSGWTDDLVQPIVTPAAAKSAAEWAHGGLADRVVLDRHAGPLAYRVDLVAGSTHREVLVDASSGKVLGEHLVTIPATPGYRRG